MKASDAATASLLVEARANLPKLREAVDTAEPKIDGLPVRFVLTVEYRNEEHFGDTKATVLLDLATAHNLAPFISAVIERRLKDMGVED